MTRATSAVLFGGLVAVGYAVWRNMRDKEQEPEFVYVPASTPEASDAGNKYAAFAPLVDWGIGALFDGLGGIRQDTTATASIDTLTGGVSAHSRTGYQFDRPSVGHSNRGIQGLLNLIGSVEAPKGYDQVWGGIRAKDQPPRPLTTMTVQEVLDWQDSIDSRYNSEAAGRYQFMEDTLRGLVNSGHARPNERFDRATQDRLAVTLMERRGLSDYQAGQISKEKFAQNLSKEWASLPAITRDRSGRPARGQSYYAGDGLNRSHVSQDRILSAVGDI